MAVNEVTSVDVKTLTPFKRFIMTLGELPTSYLESMTYAELVMWFCNFLQEKVIPTVNNNADALQDVIHYLENLDLQDEVDHKLDEMADDGTLQEIVADYLNSKAIFGFDNVESMKEASNLIDGSYAQTLGFYAKNDKGGALYKIRNITNANTVDNITIIPIGSDDLIAELIINDMNVKQFGAKGDGTTDDSVAIQKAIDTCNNIYFPTGTYLLSDTLNLKSDLTLIGEDAILLQHNNVSETILSLDGCNNVLIKNLHLKNDSSQEGSSISYTGQYLMTINDSDNINISNCKFTDAYARGVNIATSKNIYFNEDEFKNGTYDLLMLLEETENIYIDKCLFDTITSSLTYTYLFATGVEIYGNTYDFASRNIHITNSIFKNNPNWEGIDTHCCDGFYVKDNIIENCKVGVMASLDDRIVITEDNTHGNIFIENNLIDSTKNTNVSYGIVAGSTGSGTYLTKNVYINNNIIKNHGASSSIVQASIRAEYIRNLNINNNYVINSKGTNLYTLGILNGQVNNNNFLECSYNTGIVFYYGTWFVTCKDNHIKNLKTANMTNGMELHGIIQLDNNDIQGVTNYYSQNDGTVMSGVLTSAAMGKKGNYVKDGSNMIKYYSTDTNVRVYNNNVISSFTVSGSANSKTLTSTGNPIYYITEGQEITIPGAGNGGTDLTTVVVEFLSKSSFTVKDDILTSVTTVNVTPVKGNWTQA